MGAKSMKVLTQLKAATIIAGLAVSLGTALPAAAQSGGQGVTLKSFDGFTQLKGDLVEFDGSTYTIETVLGVIQVDALQVTCEGEACPEDLLFGAEFGIHGSNAIGAALMPTLIEGYADSIDAALVTEVGQSDLERTLRVVHPDGREMAAIDLRTGGSSAAYAGLGSAEAEIGMSSRRLRDRDLAALGAAGIRDLRDTENEHVLALDGLVVVTHPSNPVKSITIEEMALIFSGTVTNWSQIGGRDAPIQIYAGNEQSGTFQTFGSLVLAPYDVDIAPSAQRFVSNIELSDKVALDPNSIGVTAAAFQRAAKALPIRQECGILSYPTTFAMKTEEYPLARRLYLYTPPGQLSAHAKRIIDFAMSDEAQPLIAEAGFVNQSIERLSINQEGARIIHALVGEDELELGLFRDMLNELRDAERLSTTLRFTAGSSQLTPKSLSDARRLAEDIANGKYDDKEVLLVGFTDAVGQFNLNRGLSQRRAQVVLQQMIASVAPGALDETQLSARGYGELMPVGCNTSLQGRTANRRVEVWIRNRT